MSCQKTASQLNGEKEIMTTATATRIQNIKPAGLEGLRLINLDNMGRRQTKPVIQDHVKLIYADGQTTTLYTGFKIDETGVFHFR